MGSSRGPASTSNGGRGSVRRDMTFDGIGDLHDIPILKDVPFEAYPGARNATYSCVEPFGVNQPGCGLLEIGKYGAVPFPAAGKSESSSTWHCYSEVDVTYTWLFLQILSSSSFKKSNAFFGYRQTA